MRAKIYAKKNSEVCKKAKYAPKIKPDNKNV